MSTIDRLISAIIPAPVAASLARRLLKATGVGHGGIVAKSGEMNAVAAAMAFARVQTDRPVIFDVGANVGEWTKAALSRWPQGHYHLFEPSAAHLARISDVLEASDAIAVNAFALGAKAGEATLYKDAEITGLASMTRRDLDHVGAEMSITETIRVETLDEYCEARQIAEIDYLKIDVEGHELDVLAGGSSLLAKRAIAAVQFEFGGCNIDTRTYFRDFFNLFRDHGYALNIVGPGGKLVPVKRYREFCEQFATTNYVAIRRSQGSAQRA